MSPEIDSLREALASARPEPLRFAYVFGSVATGSARPGSDLDLAVDLGRPITLSDLGEFVGLVSEATGREADIVDLQTVGPILQMQVLQHGVLVCDADREARMLFEMHTPSIYADFQIEQREVMRAKLGDFAK